MASWGRGRSLTQCSADKKLGCDCSEGGYQISTILIERLADHAILAAVVGCIRTEAHSSESRRHITARHRGLRQGGSSHGGLGSAKHVVHEATRKEASMDNRKKSSLRTVTEWLHEHHLLLVVILSLLHVGLAGQHAWSPGGAYD
jgi:hypothetical protein